MQISRFQFKGLFSPERFQQFLLSAQMTEPEFIAEVSDNLLINQLKSGVTFSSFILPNELNKAYQFSFQRRDFGYFKLSLSSFIKTAKVNPQKVRDYYQAHKASFRTSDKIKVNYLLLSQNQKSQNTQATLAQKSDDLSNLTYTNPSSLTLAAKKLGLVVQTSPWFSKTGLKKGLFSNQSVLSTAFSKDVLRAKNNSPVISLANGAAIVLRIHQYQPSQVKPFTQVKQSILTLLKKNKAASKAGLEAYQISAALNHGVSPKILEKRYSIQWIKKKSIQENNRSIPAFILTSAFSTRQQPNAMVLKKLASNTELLPNGNYLILKVTSVQLAPLAEATEKKLHQLKEKILDLYPKLEYDSYIQSVIHGAKIEIY